ncbi:MAG: hypothetical protein JXA03_08170 [Bacteroidales bacterium]|nr:hypothetical protein [Bacteroidales bacterium]
MANITSGKELRNAIQLLQAEQAIKGQLLKEQVFTTYESLKPVNLIKSTLKDLSSSPYLIENIVGSAVGIATGYASKKIVVGASASIFRKLFGTILQFGITNLVAQRSDTIKSVGQYIVQQIFRKSEKGSESRET